MKKRVQTESASAVTVAGTERVEMKKRVQTESLECGNSSRY
jgi:hypothetical protein